MGDTSKRWPSILIYAVIFIVGSLLAGLAGYWLKSNLTFVSPAEKWLETFWARFQIMFILAVLIERSVEVYLNATDQDGRTMVDPRSGALVQTDAKQPSMVAALVLSILVAVSGVRIIETLVMFNGGTDLLKSMVWNGIDIMVSAGMMAGGADLFHKVAEVLSGGLKRLRVSIAGPTVDGIRPLRGEGLLLDPGTSTVAYAAAAVPNYSIEIRRPAAPAQQGTLKFSHDGTTIEAPCWWDNNNRIDAGAYVRCSKTHMTTSGLPAIYLPDAISKTTGERSIFIHQGENELNSLGCVAVKTSQFQVLWSLLQPVNGRNITVAVKDMA